MHRSNVLGQSAALHHYEQMVDGMLGTFQGLNAELQVCTCVCVYVGGGRCAGRSGCCTEPSRSASPAITCSHQTTLARIWGYLPLNPRRWWQEALRADRSQQCAPYRLALECRSRKLGLKAGDDWVEGMFLCLAIAATVSGRLKD